MAHLLSFIDTKPQLDDPQPTALPEHPEPLKSINTPPQISVAGRKPPIPVEVFEKVL